VKGYVDALRHPVLSIVVRGPFGFRHLEAFIDTGFNGFVAVPDNIPYELGLARQGATYSKVASGRLAQVQTFLGHVDWVEGSVECQFVSSKLHHALVGTELLDSRVLTIDFGAAKTVEIR
jgi:predicted aspartyl protease